MGLWAVHARTATIAGASSARSHQRVRAGSLDPAGQVPRPYQVQAADLGLPWPTPSDDQQADQGTAERAVSDQAVVG